MNKSSTAHGLRESLRNLFPNGTGNGGSYSVDSRHRSSHALTSKDHLRTTDENLDLFSSNWRISAYETDSSSDVSARVNSLAKIGKNPPLDDLLFSTESGKHDYDWLLTPPGTPLFPSSEKNGSQPAVSVPAKASLTRSSSVSKISRLSLSQPEISHHPSKPSRSSSAARSSISSSNRSSAIQNTSSGSRPSAIQNTSSGSRSSATQNTSSGSRSSSPALRSSSTVRPSTPTARTPVPRSSTPSKPRPSLSSGAERPRLFQNSRPSSPTSRTYVPASHNLLPSRSMIRPSSPTRRNTVTTQPVPTSTRVSSRERSSGISSRPSSPISRPRPAIPPEYPLSTPPNLRTTLPDRPLSAGRSRPSAAPAKTLPEITSPSLRRLSSPIISRGTLVEPPIKTRVVSSQNELPERQRRLSVSSEPLGRRAMKPNPVSVEVGAFAKTSARKSIDLGSRHVGNRILSNTTLFPHSVRGSVTRGTPLDRSIALESAGNGGGGYDVLYGRNPVGHVSAKLTNFEIFESSRYDTMLLEDSKNTNWLHSIDDKSDHESVFDCGFGSLPEPFT